MGAIFSHGRTITAGVALVIILIVLAGGGITYGHAWGAFFMRWLHVHVGRDVDRPALVLQLRADPVDAEDPGRAEARDRQGDRAEALFWFRWAALATVVTGLLLAWMNGYIGSLLTFQRPFTAIGIGMWLGADHGLQRLVHHLAEPEEGARHRAGGGRREKAKARAWRC